MTTATQPYVGYEIRRPAGVRHRSITQNSEQTLAEHRERLRPDAFMQILTPPLSLREAKQWEQFRKHHRHYRPDPAPLGAVRAVRKALKRPAEPPYGHEISRASESTTAPKSLSTGKAGWTANLPPSSVVPVVRGFGRDYATRHPFHACRRG